MPSTGCQLCARACVGTTSTQARPTIRILPLRERRDEIDGLVAQCASEAFARLCAIGPGGSCAMASIATSAISSSGCAITDSTASSGSRNAAVRSRTHGTSSNPITIGASRNPG